MRNDRSYEVSHGRGRLQVNNAAALLTAALEGFGVALLAQDLVREHVGSGSLVPLLPDFDAPSRPMHLIFLGDRRQTPKLRSFIDAAVEEFGSSAAGYVENRGASDDR